MRLGLALSLRICLALSCLALSLLLGVALSLLLGLVRGDGGATDAPPRSRKRSRLERRLLFGAAKKKGRAGRRLKRGDQDAVRRIQRKLDALAPEKADAGPKHPWA